LHNNNTPENKAKYMPLTQEQIAQRIKNGKPFITGTFLGTDIAELMCKVKGSATVKESRVIRKHTVKNKNGIHVYSQFLNPGSRVERDKSGDVLKVIDEHGAEVVGTLKMGEEVVVDLQAYNRDGIGIAIMGEVTKL